MSVADASGTTVGNGEEVEAPIQTVSVIVMVVGSG